MSFLSLLNLKPENKTVFFSIPRPIHHALETYAYMEQISTDEAFNKAVEFFLNKNLYTVKKSKTTEKWIEITPTHIAKKQYR